MKLARVKSQHDMQYGTVRDDLINLVEGDILGQWEQTDIGILRNPIVEE